MTDLASTVHLVDDEDAVRDALAFLMRSHGLKVSTHASGPDLLAALDKEPDPMGCIVLDVRMEPLSGLQVQDELMRRGVKLPVIFLSGHGTSRWRWMRCRRARSTSWRSPSTIRRW